MYIPSFFISFWNSFTLLHNGHLKWCSALLNAYLYQEIKKTIIRNHIYNILNKLYVSSTENSNLNTWSVIQSILCTTRCSQGFVRIYFAMYFTHAYRTQPVKLTIQMQILSWSVFLTVWTESTCNFFYCPIHGNLHIFYFSNRNVLLTK